MILGTSDGWSMIPCPIGPATQREFIFDWRILMLPQLPVLDKSLSKNALTELELEYHLSLLNGLFVNTNRKSFQKIVQPFVCKMRRCIVIIQSSIKSNPFMSTMLLPNIPHSFKCRTKVNVNSILFRKLLWPIVRKNCSKGQ